MLVRRILAAQATEVGGALQRIAQDPIRLVGARRPLQRDPLLGGAAAGETIGVHPSLQLAVRGVERRGIEAEALVEAEEREVVVLEIHVETVGPSKNKAAGPPRFVTATARQMRKLSPQPHSSLTLGFLNLKPSFSPSRAKSSSVPSMYGRLLGSTYTFTP